jgi:hypothetical protein
VLSADLSFVLNEILFDIIPGTHDIWCRDFMRVGDHRPSSLNVCVQGTSGMAARMSSQASYPGYTVVDVMEA